MPNRQSTECRGGAPRNRSPVAAASVTLDNRKKYPNQKVFLIPVDGYIYFVPYVIEGGTIFLKTAFPHRKATWDYLKERKENG